MTRTIGTLALLVPVVLLYATTLRDNYRPDFGYSHDAFVCQYTVFGGICKDKTAVLPVAWRRFAGD